MIQVAITVVLLSGCGVSLRSLRRLLEVDPGFRPAGLLAMRVSLPAVRYKDIPSRFALNQALVDRLRGIPGLTAITTASAAPFGIAAGLVAFAALGSAMSALIFGISARDPVTLIASASWSAVVALLASWISAQRPARVDPVSALRADQ